LKELIREDISQTPCPQLYLYPLVICPVASNNTARCL